MFKKVYPYIGNGAYCYANAASMLLASVDETITPGLIEAVSGVGLSATWLEKSHQLFFNLIWPDEGLSKVFEILGFDCRKRIVPKKGQLAPLTQLKIDLKQAPVLLGSVDMGYLNYNPNHKLLYGTDHYIFIYAFKNNSFYLHDPEKFPCVSLAQNQLEQAWKSNKLVYGLDNYCYWTAPHRVSNPSRQEIHHAVVEWFKLIYKRENSQSGKEAILKAASRFKNKQFTHTEVEQLEYFALALGAKRALDFAAFFANFNPQLSKLKTQQAELFGQGQSLIAAKNWPDLSSILEKLATIEGQFKAALLRL